MPTDDFDRFEIVGVTYDNQRPDSYDAGTFIGIVVAKQPDRMKVLYVYGTSETEFAWPQFDWGNRWRDKTFAAIVTVEEATVTQREALLGFMPRARLRQLISRERPMVRSESQEYTNFRTAMEHIIAVRKVDIVPNLSKMFRKRKPAKKTVRKKRAVRKKPS